MNNFKPSRDTGYKNARTCLFYILNFLLFLWKKIVTVLNKATF